MRRNLILPLHRVKRLLRFSVAGRESETPVFDLRSAAEPIVCETKDHGPRQTAAEQRFDLPSENFSLFRIAFANGIHPELTEHKRLRIGQSLQTCQIILERFSLV